MERGCIRQPSLKKLFGEGQEALPVFGNASLLSSGASKLMDLSFVRSFINPCFQVVIGLVESFELSLLLLEEAKNYVVQRICLSHH